MPEPVFFLRIARSGSRRQILSGDQRCSAEDERESCADRLDGCYIRDFADPHRIIKTPITFTYGTICNITNRHDSLNAARLSMDFAWLKRVLSK
jgi:hypothetical protein